MTGGREIKNLLIKEYKERLRLRPMRPDLVRMKVMKKKIFKLKMKLAGARKSKEWIMSDVDLALAQLKNNKARDNDGYINEIF